MDSMIKRRNWFDNKTCYFCKKSASIFREYKGEAFVLCDKRECNRRWMDKMGMFNGLELKIL